MRYGIHENGHECAFFNISLGSFLDVFFKTSQKRKEIFDACLNEGFVLEKSISPLPVRRKIEAGPAFDITEDLLIPFESLNDIILKDDELIEIYFTDLASVEFRGNLVEDCSYTVLKYAFDFHEVMVKQIFNKFSTASSCFTDISRCLFEHYVEADSKRLFESCCVEECAFEQEDLKVPCCTCYFKD